MLLSQTSPGIEQMPAHRAFGKAQPLGDILLRHLVDVLQDHDFPLPAAQVHNVLVQPGGELAALLLICQGGGEIIMIFRGCGRQGAIAEGAQLLAPHEFRYPPQKVLRLKDGTAGLLLTGGGSKELQPDLLGKILRLVAGMM